MVAADVNLLAVLVAACLSMAIGAFWYSPAGFGKQWMQLTGMGKKSKADTKKMKQEANKAYLWMFIGSLVAAYVLALIINWSGVSGVSAGATIGLFVWLGFIATTQLSSVLWDRKPFKLFALNTAYSLVSFLIQGALLGVWI